MKPNAHDQVAALLDLIPEESRSRTVVLDAGGEVVSATFEFPTEPASLTHDYDRIDLTIGGEFIAPISGEDERLLRQEIERQRTTIREARVLPRNLPQRTVTAHTVALVSTILALGDATIGPRVIEVLESSSPTRSPWARRPVRLDVFGNPRPPRGHMLSLQQSRVALASEPGDLERISKAEAKRARKAAKRMAQERKA